MTLVLRKCKSNGHSSRNFFYGNTGERVNCPDWNPQPNCGNGLHGLKEGNGDWNLLEGYYWLIIDADDQIVDIDEHKCKFNTGIIKFRGTTEELANSEFPSLLQLNSECAYNWAYYIGNRDIMIHRIVESKWAYWWARDFGNHDIMANKITDSAYAFYWAIYIGNHDIMIDKITDSAYAFYWADTIGNQDIMINKITDSQYAFYWAKYVGNQDIMKNKITDPFYIRQWNDLFIDNLI